MGIFKTLIKIAKGDVSGAAHDAVKTVAGQNAADRLSEGLVDLAETAIEKGTEALRNKSQQKNGEDAGKDKSSM